MLLFSLDSQQMPKGSRKFLSMTIPGYRCLENFFSPPPMVFDIGLS